MIALTWAQIQLPLTVTDQNGNQSSCEAVVTVIEGLNTPIAVCQNITVTLDEDGTATTACKCD